MKAMAQMKADVALLTERRYVAQDVPESDWYRRNILRDDQLLQEALDQIGISSVRVDWSFRTRTGPGTAAPFSGRRGIISTGSTNSPPGSMKFSR